MSAPYRTIVDRVRTAAHDKTKLTLDPEHVAALVEAGWLEWLGRHEARELQTGGVSPSAPSSEPHLHDRPFSPAGLAKRWDVTPSAVYAMIKSGTLPAFKLGSKLYRVRARDVEEYERVAEAEAARMGSSSPRAPRPVDAGPRLPLNRATIAALTAKG